MLIQTIRMSLLEYLHGGGHALRSASAAAAGPLGSAGREGFAAAVAASPRSQQSPRRNWDISSVPILFEQAAGKTTDEGHYSRPIGNRH
jgi:hypothetical protein